MSKSSSKECSQCKEVKPLTQFHKKTPRRGNGFQSKCKVCRCHRARQDYKPDHAEERRRHLRDAFGLTVEQYNEMLVAQRGKCAVCGTTSPTKSGRFIKNFSVDHDHTTGRIRGLLCHNCNRGLGMLNDSVEHIQNALDYLRKHTDGG